jgi:hypothetical protein
MTCKTCCGHVERAERLRAIISGCVSLALGGAELERTYGGRRELHLALCRQLGAAEQAALDLVHATACATCTCIVPVANDQDSTRRP